MQDHFLKLERMYLSAPVQKIYKGISISIEKGRAKISWPVDPTLFHAGGSLHGSVYFRLLDDAAYFACNSLSDDYFLLTSTFHIDFFRPVSKGILQSEGKIVKAGKKVFYAESDLYDEKDKLVASGKGSFMKSTMLLNSINNYE